MKNRTISLSIIIVIYDEFQSIKRCLDSIYRNRVKNSEILLVHNPSGKKGIHEVLKNYPHIRYIKNIKNVGFGSAVNNGIMQSRGKYILVLTPDIRVFPNTITPTLNFIKSHSKVAVVGCKVFSDKQEFNRSAFNHFPNILSHVYEYNIVFLKFIRKLKKEYIPSLYSEKEHKHILYPKHIVGAYLLLRKSAIEAVGMFDSAFFLYREETDLCNRLFLKGWKIAYLPVGGVAHYGDGSTREKYTQCSPHYLKSTYRFFSKYHTKIYVIFAWIIGFSSSLMSIPFLYLNCFLKDTYHNQSQPRLQLFCWIRILKWHIKPGIKLVLLS